MVKQLILRTYKENQIVRFIIVGSFNTGISYFIYALLIFVGLNYAIANLCALLLGILVSFTTQGRLVFGNRDLRRFGRFVISWTIIYLLSIAIIGQLIQLGFNAYIAGALALPFTTASSYLVQKYFVFHVVKTSNKNGTPTEDNPT